MKEAQVGAKKASESENDFPAKPCRKRKMKKTLAMYITMVAVSTSAIFFLEHVTLVNAFRTALVAAIGKTFAANWVSSVFE